VNLLLIFIGSRSQVENSGNLPPRHRAGQVGRGAVKVIEVAGLDLGRILTVIEVLCIPCGRMTRSSFKIDQQGFLPRTSHLILCNVFRPLNEGSYQCCSSRTKENFIINLRVPVWHNAKNHGSIALKIFG
jgi:hypothetical protein